MNLRLLRTVEKAALYQLSAIPLPPPALHSGGSDGEKRISPSVLLIIVILAVIFFISGLLHLLVRFLFRPSYRDAEELDNVTVLQGQLQQLFHLHDSGVDQSFIDTLPVFLYKAIIGVKNPFDCAVCLCEFEADDKLRLLPKCSHAFHLDCIDTWLLSHSTCPLCRASLLPEYVPNNSCSSPLVLVLESGSESSRELTTINRGESLVANTSSRRNISSHLSFRREDDNFLPCCTDISQKPPEIHETEEKIVSVKLGKFRNVSVVSGEGEGTSTNRNVDERRCFSMGSFEYVLDESSVLKVAVKPPARKQSCKKLSLPLTPGHKPAMSECGHSGREDLKGFDSAISGSRRGESDGDVGFNTAAITKRESFSVSKIWLQSEKTKSPTAGSSRRAFSFRFPLQSKQNSAAVSEIDVSDWGSQRSEMGLDLEANSSNSVEFQANLPSFARTLLWLVGRQNKVVHSPSITHGEPWKH